MQLSIDLNPINVSGSDTGAGTDGCICLSIITAEFLLSSDSLGDL